jgi:hypothetical protein
MFFFTPFCESYSSGLIAELGFGELCASRESGYTPLSTMRIVTVSIHAIEMILVRNV